MPVIEGIVVPQEVINTILRFRKTVTILSPEAVSTYF